MKLLMCLILTALSANVLAYGGSSSTKACAKPKLTNFTPPHLSVVEPNSGFSFEANTSTVASSIRVTVKKQPVDVIIKEVPNGYTITGTLPPSLENTYARININATSGNKCKGSDGWLLKIEGANPK